MSPNKSASLRSVSRNTKSGQPQGLTNMDFDAGRQYSSPCRLQASLTRSAAGMRTLDRPVILLVSSKSISSWMRCAYANRKICAHGAICARSLECEHSDSASLDYVAFGSTGLVKVQIIAVHKQKRDNHEGYLSFVGGACLTKVEPLAITEILFR